MTRHDSGPRRPGIDPMAWNTPGGPAGRKTPGGGGFGGLLDKLPGFGGGFGGAGGALRWIWIALALWLAFNCFVLVGEQDRGVVLRFGQYARTMQPGPNFKLPWPVETVQKVRATQVRTYSNTVPVLTRDENIVNVTFNVQYRVSDPRLFLFGTRDAAQVLEQTAISTVREQIGRSELDAALNARGPLSAAAAKALQASLDAYRTGLIVTELNLQDARPPEEVKPAFDEVNSAQQMNERLINEASAYAAKVVPEARGEAARVLSASEGFKTAAVARATGDAARFNLLVEQYQAAPEVTRKRLWLETVQQVLSQNRKVVGGDGRQLIYVPMQGATGTMPGPVAQGVLPELALPAAAPGGEPVRPVRSTRPAGREEATR